MMIQYPVLVYGNLRQGFYNYERYIKGKTIREEIVTIDGFTMFGEQHYPYLVRGDSTVTATLIDLDPFLYDEVMCTIDRLEGFRSESHARNHYDRVLHTFVFDGVECTAWLYIASEFVRGVVVSRYPVLKSGDWANH